MLKINRKKHHEDEILQNLMVAHKRHCEVGDVKGIIKLSRYLLKFLSKFDNEVYQFGTENGSEGNSAPPNRRITDKKGERR